MSKIWSPTRPLCSPVVRGPGARTVTRWSTGRLLMPVTPTPLAGFGSGTARLTETILLTPGNLTAPATARRAFSPSGGSARPRSGMFRRPLERVVGDVLPAGHATGEVWTVRKLVGLSRRLGVAVLLRVRAVHRRRHQVVF